jgi:hypothetical protein
MKDRSNGKKETYAAKAIQTPLILSKSKKDACSQLTWRKNGT